MFPEAVQIPASVNQLKNTKNPASPSMRPIEPIDDPAEPTAGAPPPTGSTLLAPAVVDPRRRRLRPARTGRPAMAAFALNAPPAPPWICSARSLVPARTGCTAVDPRRCSYRLTCTDRATTAAALLALASPPWIHATVCCLRPASTGRPGWICTAAAWIRPAAAALPWIRTALTWIHPAPAAPPRIHGAARARESERRRCRSSTGEEDAPPLRLVRGGLDALPLRERVRGRAGCTAAQNGNESPETLSVVFICRQH